MKKRQPDPDSDNPYEPYTNEEAAELLSNEEHLDGRAGDYWSGTHPAFNQQHAYPFTAVIELQTGVVYETDPIPQVMSAKEVLEAVKELNED